MVPRSERQEADRAQRTWETHLSALPK